MEEEEDVKSLSFDSSSWPFYRWWWVVAVVVDVAMDELFPGSVCRSTTRRTRGLQDSI